MSRMSTDENIELHITASADDILEVSPVNSYINSNSEFSPRDRSGSSDDSGSSGSDDDNSQGDGEPSESITSPTESLRHRRSQQMNAFSSSSEGSSKGNYDDDDNDGISNGNGDYDYDDDDSAGSSSGSGSSTDSGSETDSRRQQPPSSQQQQPQQHVSSSNKNDQTSTNTNTNTNIDHPDNSGILPPSSSSSPSQQQSQQQPRKKGRAATPQSEFDKALLTGVPSRGYATSFFSADSADSADGATVPTTTAVEDALSAAIMAASAGAGGAADPSSIPQQQLAPSRTGSWDEAATDVTTSSSSAKPHRITQQQQQNPPKKEKERKAHRVNITTTTQSAPTPAITPSTTAAPASSSNNYPPPPPSSHAKSSAPSYTTAGSAALKNKPKKTNSNSNASSFESSGGAPLHAPNNNGNNNKNNNTNTYDNGDHIQDLSSGVLPDVLMTMRQKIESMQLFDSDMMKLAEVDSRHMDEMDTETRAALKRSSQQSISAAVLVSLAHKRYERRRLAAMEIEKVVRSLVQQNELERVRAILLLLSDDYVRSTSEDARKGGVVALAACAIGLKKAHDKVATVMECRDLVLASVVHACQDHSQRVRYYATESLFNVVKVIPGLAVQHFFILFEILRSLWADVDGDVRSGAELLDKKLKEVILGAVNSGSFSTDACVPVFARFVYMRNKATKKLTLSWLQELNEKLIGAPILEFLHLFLGGIFDMVADPSTTIRQAALAFLQSVLPKLLVVNSEAIDDMDDAGMKVDFDSILQSLVTTMEHPDPFVRKVAMFWVSRIVKAHMKELHARSQASNNSSSNNNGKQPSSNSSSPTMMNPDGRLSPTKKSSEADNGGGSEDGSDMAGGGEDNTSSTGKSPQFKAASISVRNSLPHVLPGILLSIGDTFKAKGARDSFLPDQTTNQLAEETNACLRDAVRRDGKSYVQHLDSFIVALREELSSPGGLNSRNPPAEERKLYRLDVKPDGTGIESPGWFRASNEAKERNEESMVSSRLCALHWIIVLYESVVPDQLKAEYAREFIIPIIHQLVDNPPERIVFKSLEVLAKITVPVLGEDHSRLDQGTPRNNGTSSLSGFNTPQPAWASPSEYSPDAKDDDDADFPMTDANASFALDILHPSRRKFKSRDREVFTALIQLHSYNQQLLVDLSRVIAYMCKLQPAEFVFVSFAVELDRFVRRLQKQRTKQEESNLSANSENTQGNQVGQRPFSSNLEFVSSFVEQMCHGLLNADEAQPLRDTLRDCVGFTQSSGTSAKVHRAVRLFHIMLHSFSHSIVATVSLCLWGGAYRTASMFLARIVPLDINLMFLLELDKLVEQLERPLFRHLHVRMLERDIDPKAEGSGAMLFETLKFLLMIIPQSTCYNVLKERVASISRFRQSTGMMPKLNLGIRTDQNEADTKRTKEQTDVFVERVLKVRATHCDAMWHTIRSESLESQPLVSPNLDHEEGESRRRWLGYASKEEQQKAEERYRREKQSQHQGSGLSIEELDGYQDLGEEPTDSIIEQQLNEKFERETNRLMMEESEHDNPPALRQDATSEEQAQDDGAWKAYWEDD